MKSGFLDKLIERIDLLDPGSLQSHFLRLSQEKGLMETIFHALQEGIIVLDGGGRISYANRAAEKFLGFQLESAAGNLINKYLRDIEWDKVLRLDEDEWSRLVSREIETTYPDHRFLAFYVVPLAVVSPKEDGAVVIFRDITGERANEAKVLESERLHAITLLAASVAHEIGNPLNSLNIHLQLLAREIEKLPEKDKEHLGDLLLVSRQEVSRLDGIITQFLRALKPMHPEFESADLARLLEETLEVMRPEIADRGILVEVETPGKLPSTLVDRGQIKQAFFNVIKNAIQAMSKSGVLKIDFAETDRFVAVSFKDTGPGIPAEELGHVFEPYHTTKADGSGIGLMIVQRVVRDHGGEIEIHSEPEHGTRITLFIPREDRRVRLLKAHKSGRTKAGEA